MTGATIKMEKGLTIPPVRKSKKPNCKVSNSKKENAFICNQDKVYDSLLSNPLAFVFFYVFSIVFIALLFQLSQRKKNKKK